MGKLTEGEWAVLNALWTGDRLTLGEVTAALDPALRWRRNTVLTYLTGWRGRAW